ncbi:hypothetical protein BKH43_05095 [Helicobacter sp. 13S00401-1]|uniref:TonB C-terminal domain-containing protein n=1 Tax=Helicobacter sp. 13S00401-1 TaxID=1905758 RepID=UPI000BDD1D15|nr:TonB C-terminal domain-containing protein [Helicobacter sp. 13S00401-1]PAF50278.1 hypothetical protein BKH43_05095 [Helicobacter sp. 13S00401-1]
MDKDIDLSLLSPHPSSTSSIKNTLFDRKNITNPKLCLISAISSIIIYILIVFLLVIASLNFYKAQKLKHYSDKSEVDVFSNMPVAELKQKSIDVSSLMPQSALPKTHAAPEDKNIALPTPPKPSINLSDMFANIPNLDLQKKLKQDNIKKQEELKKQQALQRLKAEEELETRRRQQQKELEMLQQHNLALQETIKNVSATSSNLSQKVKDSLSLKLKVDKSASIAPDQKGIYDKWYAEVQNIIYSKWNSNFYEQAKLSARVSIDSEGHFRYMYLESKSNSDEFNTKTINFLQSLQSVQFPKPINGRVEIIINFVTQINNQ